jgi:hypothetical protein
VPLLLKLATVLRLLVKLVMMFLMNFLPEDRRLTPVLFSACLCFDSYLFFASVLFHPDRSVPEIVVYAENHGQAVFR